MKKLLRSVLGLSCLAVVHAGCLGGGSPVGGKASSAGDKFAVDQMKCNAKNHLRPFIIEWDATDMSSFEARASKDIIFVRYQGCEMQVLDNCNDDSVKGSLGSYKSIDWTSGSLEKLDVENEAELYAKLPLGVATLGGKVSSGEKLHMEYFVAGTRSATRDAVYRKDLEKIPGCKGATHFVYNYNLGAFAIGTVSTTNVEGDASVYGFGAGGSKKSTRKADKQGGDLGLCKSESAKEIDGCKVPVRLTLREIADGENPDQTAQKAPDTDASLNAAGKINQKLEMSGKAQEYYEAAAAKMNAKDGKGCLKELDNHDKADPKHLSTEAKSGFAYLRGQCLMLAGQCDAGKVMVRKSLEATSSGNMGPEMMDKTVEAFVSMYCQGANMKPRDQMLKALKDLQDGALMTKKDVGFCKSNAEIIKRLSATVKPQDDEDSQIANGPKNLYFMGAQCLGRAGDCAAAWKFFMDEYPTDKIPNIKDPKQKEKTMKSIFGSLVQKCKEKEQ